MPKTIKTIINQATDNLLNIRCVALLCVRFSGSIKAITTLLIAIAITTAASAQVTYIYGDTTKIKARGTGNNELQIFNATRSIEGFLYNTGNGLTQFKPAIDTAIALNDSTVRFSRGSAYFDITIHSTSGTSTSGWSITGNAGTTAGTNFIGTTDAQSLYFKVNNVVAGWLDAIGTNTSFGVDALTSIGSAGANTAIGHEVLHNNSTGIQNTGLGYQALMATTSGDYNTAIGSYSLTGITTATHNTAVGVFSLSSLSTGAAYANNTGIGYNAGYGMISSDYGTYLGYKATGSNNLNSATAIGAYAKAEQSNSLILGSVNGINGASQTVRVGIGTTQPSNTLHVAGTLKFVTGNQGAGKVLTSDADGVADWADATGTTYTNGYGLLLSADEFSVDTGLITTKDWLYKVADSLASELGSGTNIYNADGTLTSNRVLDGDGHNLTFNNLDAITLSSATDLNLHSGNIDIGNPADAPYSGTTTLKTQYLGISAANFQMTALTSGDFYGTLYKSVLNFQSPAFAGDGAIYLQPRYSSQDVAYLQDYPFTWTDFAAKNITELLVNDAGTASGGHFLSGYNEDGGIYEPSALLDLNATDKGFLIPRMTTTQRDAIISPATSLMIYNTTTSTFEYYTGSAWAALGGGTTETDPIFTASDAYGISSSDITNWNGKLNISDTASMLSPYARTSALALKLNIADTASMLSPYQRSAAATAALALKLNISDTASMLSPYQRSAAATAALALKLNISDTAAMLSPYQRSAAAAATFATITNLALKLNISDTAAMLSPYQRSAAATAALALKLNISDTAAMLSPYLLNANANVTFATKQAALVSGTNIKTVNGSSLLGSGNLAVGDALAANPLSQFSATTSSQLAGVLSDESGTGSVVYSNSPTLVTPALGTPSAIVLPNATGLPLTTGVTGILPGTNGGTGVNNGSNTITIGGNVQFSGAFIQTITATANTSVTLPPSGTLLAGISATATLDFPNTSAGGASDLTMTLTGAAVGDAVVVGAPSGSVPASGLFFGWVSASDTITIRFLNGGGGGQNPASGTFKATIIK